MTLTPTTRGAFLAGLGFWGLLWAALFKLDGVVEGTMLQRRVSTERCLQWISRRRSTTLLGTELCNYSVHGISQVDSVVFAMAGTAVNAMMILCVLPVRALLKRRS